MSLLSVNALMLFYSFSDTIVMTKMTCVHIFKKFFLKILLSYLTAAVLVQGEKTKKIIITIIIYYSLIVGHNQSVDVIPEFLAPLENLTATQGRDIQFTCIVNDLGSFRVSNWTFFNNFTIK